MAATSSGRVAKPLRSANGGSNAPTKNHRFESFNQRVAKLKIDPISKARRHDVDYDDLNERTTYFGTRLSEWRELNLSEHFTDFVQEVENLCDSFHQVLYHQDRIMDILVKYIESGNALSLEPLLSLLGALAHDLEEKFKEAHFACALSTVTKIAASHQDVEVIEWCFTSLAWLFKYLSRLLVPNLCPTYDVMATLLGKSHQKPHIARFAGEALSFLIRKAASQFHKNKEPLVLITKHALQDYHVRSLKDSGEVYRHGVMTLFADAIKGVDTVLHSNGTTVFRCLVKEELRLGAGDISSGVLISLIHHTDASTFSPLLEVLAELTDEVTSEMDLARLCIWGDIFFITASVRQGSRVSDWSSLLGCICKMQALSIDRAQMNESSNSIIENSAAVGFQYAPLNAVIPRFKHFVDTLLSKTPNKFLAFCVFFSDLGRERFESLLRPYFFKYIEHSWQSSEKEVLESVHEITCTIDQTTQKEVLKGRALPASWAVHILADLKSIGSKTSNPAKLNGYLELSNALSLGQQHTLELAMVLQKGVAKELLSPSPELGVCAFALGGMLSKVLELPGPLVDITVEKFLRVLASKPALTLIPLVLSNLASLIKAKGDSVTNDQGLARLLTRNLSAPDKELRRSSLKLLENLYEDSDIDVAEAFRILNEIESTPLDLNSQRVLSMHVRRLPSFHAKHKVHPWIGRVIPQYLFGLLTLNFSSVWTDAVEAMKAICASSDGEVVVAEIAFNWLQEENRRTESPPTNSPQIREKRHGQYDCTHLTTLRNTIQTREVNISSADVLLQQRFESLHATRSTVTDMARSQALRALLGVPWIAEKRSRQLIPLFLRWFRKEGEGEQSTIASEDHEAALSVPGTTHNGPFRKDRKAMLELFGAFVNPKALYKTNEVFNTLLSTLTSGDKDLQKLALKAIFTWKLSGVKPYEENLLNITDEARFREELTVFVRRDSENGIQTNHKLDLMPVLLRLLYGKITARVSASSNNTTSQSVRRRAAFDSLSKFEDGDIKEFMDVALGPLRELDQVEPPSLVLQIMTTPRQELGIVNMIKDMVDVIGSRLSFLTPTLMPALLCCVSKAVNLLQMSSEDTVSTQSQLSLFRDIRQAGLQCLVLIYSRFPSHMVQEYTPTVFRILITPRIEKLPVETAQGISGLLQLLSIWASSPALSVNILNIDQFLLVKVVDILNVASAKDEVILYTIYKILKPLVEHTQLNPTNIDDTRVITAEDLQPFLDHILRCAGDLLEKSPSKSVLGAAIELVSLLSSTATESSQIRRLLQISSFLIDQPSSRVFTKAKGDLLRIVERLAPAAQINENDELFQRLFRSVSSLFKYFRDRENRRRLCAALDSLADIEHDLLESARICDDLNAFDTARVDEPDYDRRLQAYTEITKPESHLRLFSEQQWTPIIYNALHYIRDEDLAIRSSASLSIRRFIDSAASEQVESNGDPQWRLVIDVLLPSLKSGVADQLEVVRTEYLANVAHLIHNYPDWKEINDMSPLLMNDDEEASFFNNILHIQQHRRLRALDRLAEEGRKERLGSANIAHFFLPLIEHFVFERGDDENAGNLAASAITTIGFLSNSLEWPQIRAIFRRYAGYIASKPELEKGIIKLLGLLIDAIGLAASTKEANASQATHTVDSEMVDGDLPTHTTHERPRTLVLTIPRQEKLSEDLVKNILPSLSSYLHEKDESKVSLRVPVAVSLVKLLKLLPESAFAERLPPLLTDVCHILRSKAQESRDLTRRTLVDISTLIGPEYFGFVVKELRGSLARGYQLHVLSYTVHSILVETSAIWQPGQLDYCLPQVVSIVMDDIFGTTGLEKDAEEYISKMKEVKSRKSFDSMELLAKISSISRIAALIKPIQVLLDEKIDLKAVKKIDELLRRIGSGLLRNNAAGSQQTLMFCYEIIQQVYKHSNKSKGDKVDPRMRRFLVNAKAAKFGLATKSTSSFKYKLTKFAFDLLRMVLHKHETLKTRANLFEFLPAIGGALLEAHEEVQTAALRLIAEIVKVDMAELDRSAAAYVSEAVKVIKNAMSTNTEISQAALKVVTAVLREKPDIRIKETDIAFLLQKLKPDLEEPDRQGVTFNFLKAVLFKKIVITEVYETMDAIAAMMVTNQSRTTRDMARGVYFQFLLNYPQAKNRLAKQLSFLAKNLDYKHVEGRMSVLEAIHHLISKAPPDLMEDLCGVFFVPLVLSTINDDSSKCREMAGTLLKNLLAESDGDQLQNMLKLMGTWLAQDDQHLLLRASLQLYASLVEVDVSRAEKEIETMQTRIIEILKVSMAKRTVADWAPAFYALQLESKLVNAFPASTLAKDMAPLWAIIRECSFFPHAWVKFAAAKLLGLFFADIGRANAENGALKLQRKPTVLAQKFLQGSHGLQLAEAEMVFMLKAFLRNLRNPEITEDLAAQLARNIVFLGKLLPQVTAEQIEEGPYGDESDVESASDAAEEVNASKSPLQYLFERLSGILRRDLVGNQASALLPKTTALHICAALCRNLPKESLEPCAQIILLPLLQLTDSTLSTPFSLDPAFNESYKSLAPTSQEIMSILQNKLETSTYIKEVAAVQSTMKKRRDERRVKRRLDAINDPERLAREKRRKVERQHVRRKEKTAEFRNRRRGV